VQDSADANGTDLHIDLEESDQEELMDQGQAQEGQEGQDAQIFTRLEDFLPEELCIIYREQLGVRKDLYAWQCG